MTTPIIVTRGYRGHTPGTHLHLPDGIAASMIAAGMARRPDGWSPDSWTYETALPPTPTSGQDSEDGTVPTVEPPRAGPGSAKAGWLRHAAALGVPVADDATRDEIIAAVDARHGPAAG